MVQVISISGCQRIDMKKLPTYDSLMNPILKALRFLGGSASIDEMYDKVVEIENIDEEISSVFHDQEKSNQTEVSYRLAWARTYLKKYGVDDKLASIIIRSDSPQIALAFSS